MDLLDVMSSTRFPECHLFGIPSKSRSKNLKLRKDGRKHSVHKVLMENVITDNSSLGNGLRK